MCARMYICMNMCTHDHQGDLSVLKAARDAQVVELKNLITIVQGDLSKAMRQVMMCLITMDTHGRDIMGKLIDEQVTSADAFQWQAQLKAYWIDDLVSTYAVRKDGSMRPLSWQPTASLLACLATWQPDRLYGGLVA
eukprot:GHVU01012538.1.p2 GENE.GHVU01012538.1~~GHVU01012538.1.p2  ORF type:complete len:137 (+),score=17.32 GHVU01012538.1:724-1134(+)